MIVEHTVRFMDCGADSYQTSPTVCLEKPRDRTPLDILHAECARKYNGHVTVRYSTPHRPRSTGWKSQNHHLRGHARQLCGYTGFSMSEMMQVIKEDTPSWPVEYKEFRGKRRAVYASEADISVEVASEAIEICHRIAADNEWTLKEGEE